MAAGSYFHQSFDGQLGASSIGQRANDYGNIERIPHRICEKLVVGLYQGSDNGLFYRRSGNRPRNNYIMKNRLPIELLCYIAKWIPLQYYIRWRYAARFTLHLDEIPTLCFEAYRESTAVHGGILQSQHRMKLCADYVNDTSFLFLAMNGHAAEVIRILESRNADRITLDARHEAFREIIGKDFSPDMIVALLTDDRIDPNIKVTFHGGEVVAFNVDGRTMLILGNLQRPSPPLQTSSHRQTCKL
jgi:hypothetical protein